MKILVSAFACAPTGGSEGGVGWRWATALAEGGHDVMVLTDVHRRDAIERELAARPVDGLAFDFHRPRVLSRVPLQRRTAQLLYSLWQYLLLPHARRLHRRHRFDLVLHLTYGVFRHPSFLGFLDAPFVFGPVGGGEDAPASLKRALPWRARASERLRATLNTLARANPFLRLALSRADLVLVKTAQTADALPASVRERCRVHVEIGVTDDERPNAGARLEDAPLEVLCAARTYAFKGLDLAVDAIAAARETHPRTRLTLIGSGPLDVWLDRRIRDAGLDDAVVRIAHLPQADLFDRYAASHCLLFPSLHDSSGNVVLEAMRHGLPVVCLDIGGPATIIDRDCGIAVATEDGSRDAVVQRLADALISLHDEPTRRRMGAAAAARASTWTWRSRCEGALALARPLLSNAPSAEAIADAPAGTADGQAARAARSRKEKTQRS